jgi:hypothetical protein
MKAGVGGRRRGCDTRGAQVQDAGLYEPQDTKVGSAPPVIALRAPSRRRRTIWATRSRKRRAGRAVAEPVVSGRDWGGQRDLTVRRLGEVARPKDRRGWRADISCRR